MRFPATESATRHPHSSLNGAVLTATRSHNPHSCLLFFTQSVRHSWSSPQQRSLPATTLRKHAAACRDKTILSLLLLRLSASQSYTQTTSSVQHYKHNTRIRYHLIIADDNIYI